MAQSSTEPSPPNDPSPRTAIRPDYESQPVGRSEYVTALSHFYRGEMNRALSWRARLDTTTNWAVVATLGILTFSFNNPQYSQETLIAVVESRLAAASKHKEKNFRSRLVNHFHRRASQKDEQD